MRTTINHIHLENFGKHSETVGGKTLDFDLRNKTIISGCNRTGKSTVKRAIQYILGCKDENGKEIAGIRPHDDNGVDIDGLTTVAEMTVSVDGMENTLKRICFQEKNRQGEYTGKDNVQYFVDDVRKGTKKAYEEFTSKFFPVEVCMSAQEFLSKDTAGRRATLEVFSKHDTESIISENAEFEPLRAKLNANSTDDLKKTCREKIKTKTKERDAFPAKIEVLNGQKTDIDVSELELAKNSLNEQIADVKAKQADISKEFEEQQKASDGVIELKMELNDLQRKANEELVKTKQGLQRLHDIEIGKERDLRFKKRTAENEIIRLQREIDNLKHSLENDRNKWREVSEKKFDESSCVCSYCGQEYPAEKKDELREDFEKNKEDELKIITERGNKNRRDLAAAEDERSKNRKKIEEIDRKLKETDKECWRLQKEEDNLPQSIDISNRPEVQEIKRQIAEKEQAMNKGNSASEIRENLQSQLEDLQSQLMEVNSKIALAQRNVDIDEQIADLQKQQLSKSQEIADVERELDLLKQFERKKAELLESDVNEYFEHAKIKMFATQVNGDLKDVCELTINGTSYDGNLNHGDRILTEIDICRAFQKKYGIECSIIIDDSESLDPWRLPNVPNQLIVLRWGENRELKIEVEGVGNEEISE